MEWRSLDGPVTRDWWALEANGERLALVQPFEGRASIVLYYGRSPWEQKRGTAGSIAQGKRFAERWIAARRKFPIAAGWSTA